MPQQPDYDALAKQHGGAEDPYDSMAAEHGGELYHDPQEFHLKDVPGGGALQYVGDVLKNAPGSALKLGADLLMSPITAPLALGRAAYDIGSAAMGNRAPLAETANRIGPYFRQRYGGLSNIAETVRTDPVGAAADFITVAEPPAALLKPLLPGAAKMARNMDPTRMAGTAVAGAVEGAGKTAESLATRTYQRALRPAAKNKGLQGLADQTRAAAVGLREEAIPSTKASKIPLADRVAAAGLKPEDLRHIPKDVHEEVIHKYAVLEAKANRDIASKIDSLTQQGFQLDRAGKSQLVNEAMKYVKEQHPGADLPTRREIYKLGQKEKTTQLQDPAMNPQPTLGGVSDYMTPEMMQARKQELRSGQVYGKEPGKVRPSALEDEMNKAVAHQMAKQLETWDPSLSDANMRAGDYKLLMNALTDFVARTRKTAPSTRTQIGYSVGRTAQTLVPGIIAGGLGTAAGGAGVGAGLGAVGVLAALALGQPSIKARVAIAMHKAGRATSTLGKAARRSMLVPGVPEAMSATQRILVAPPPTPSLEETE